MLVQIARSIDVACAVLVAADALKAALDERLTENQAVQERLEELGQQNARIEAELTKELQQHELLYRQLRWHNQRYWN